MKQILFFPGFKMPRKRYKQFLVHFSDNFCYVEDEKCILNFNNDDELIIIGHSIGILKGTMWCIVHDLIPDLIISLDGTEIDPEKLKQKKADKSQPIQDIYDSYVQVMNEEFWKKTKSVLFRYKPNQNESDQTFYDCIYVHEDLKIGHHPYLSKRIIQRIKKKAC